MVITITTILAAHVEDVAVPTLNIFFAFSFPWRGQRKLKTAAVTLGAFTGIIFPWARLKGLGPRLTCKISVDGIHYTITFRASYKTAERKVKAGNSGYCSWILECLTEECWTSFTNIHPLKNSKSQIPYHVSRLNKCLKNFLARFMESFWDYE